MSPGKIYASPLAQLVEHQSLNEDTTVMYRVYMRNLGDIVQKIPISVSTLYKVSCLFNPTTESSLSFCIFRTPGSSTALVKEFRGFSGRRLVASRIAPKNNNNKPRE